MSYRFHNLDLSLLTLENCKELLPSSLALQVEMFLPPEGSFDNESLQRYLENIKN